MSAPVKARDLRPDWWIRTQVTRVPGAYRVLHVSEVYEDLDGGVKREYVRLTLRRISTLTGFIDQTFLADSDVEVI